MRIRTLCTSLLLVLSTPAAGQICPTGERLLKNDNLPDLPGGTPIGTAIIRGLCEGESAFTVFDSVGGDINLNEVSVLFAAAGGVPGAVAAIDVTFHDGATENVGQTGAYSLGPQLWSLSGDGGANAQVTSTSLNILDLRPFGDGTVGPLVTVTSGKLVAKITIVLNSNGSCLFGYTANLATDWTGAGSSCSPPGINGITLLSGQNIDPSTFAFPNPITGGTVILCAPSSNFFAGNWVIRTCITESQPAALTTWQGFAQPGGIILIQQSAPASPNNGFVTLIGGGITTGTPTPWGNWPIDFDIWTDCFFGACRGLLTNHFGTLDSTGQAFTTLSIPADPSLAGSGLTWYASFFAFDPNDFFNWTDIGAPSDPIIIN